MTTRNANKTVHIEVHTGRKFWKPQRIALIPWKLHKIALFSRVTYFSRFITKITEYVKTK